MILIQLRDALHGGLDTIEHIHAPIGLFARAVEILGGIARALREVHACALGTCQQGLAGLIDEGCLFILGERPTKGCLLRTNKGIGHLAACQMASISGEDLQIGGVHPHLIEVKHHITVACGHHGQGRGRNTIKRNTVIWDVAVLKDLAVFALHKV